MIQPGVYSSVEVMDAVMAGEPLYNVPQHWLDVQDGIAILAAGRVMELAHD